MDFRLVIDTREQEPYTFDCASIRHCLEAGDYSVQGYESRVAVERKSLVDLCRTVIHERARFERELVKLTAHGAACVVVEADLDRVLRGEHAGELRGVSPASLLGAALHIQIQHGIPVIWCGSRPAARHFTEQFLRMYVRLAGAPPCPQQ